MAFLQPNLPTQRVETGKRDDFPVSNSEYGRDIPIGHGTYRLSGNIIWTSGIRRSTEVTRETTGGKGGTPSQTTETTTYFYYADLAIAFAEGPCTALLRVWADGKLVYSEVGGSLESSVPASVRFYRGDEGQLPDDLIVDDVGEELTPGYRGLVYIVVENLLLSDFGNRIPAIEAEIVFVETEGVEAVETKTLNLPGAAIQDSIVTDYPRDRAYAQDQNDPSLIYVIRLSDMTLVRTTNIANTQYRIGCLFPKTGELVLVNETANLNSGDQNRAALFDPLTGVVSVERNGLDVDSVSAMPFAISRVFDGTLSHVILSHDGQNDRLRSHTGFDLTIVESDRTNGEFGAVVPTDERFTYVIRYEEENDGSFRFDKVFVDGYDALYAGGTRGGVRRIDLRGDAVDDDNPPIAETGINGFDDSVNEFIQPLWDSTSGSVLMVIKERNANNYIAVRWTEDDRVIWAQPVPIAYNAGRDRAVVQSRLVGANWAWVGDGGTILSLDIGSGTINATFNGVRTFTGVPTAIAATWFDGAQQAVYALSADGLTMTRHSLSLFTNLVADSPEGTYRPPAVTIKDYLFDMFRRSGLAPTAEIDLSAVDGAVTVTGVIADKNSTFRQAVEPVLDAYLTEVIEEDFRLRAAPLGAVQTPVATITRDNLVRATGDIYVVERTQEQDLPVEVEVSYSDPFNAYQTTTQRVSRFLNVTPTVQTGKKTSLNRTQLALDASQARQTAENALYTAWLQREVLTFRIPQKYLKLSATDVIAVDLQDAGQTRRLRIDRASVGADFASELRLLDEIEDQFDSDIAGDSGSASVQTIIPGPAVPSELFLMDLTLLGDEDLLPQMSTRYYWAGSAFDDREWPGATLQFGGTDGNIYRDLTTAVNAAIWGFTTQTVDPPQSPWVFDRENTVELSIVRGADLLESVSETQLIENERINQAVLLRANGPEIIQFATVEQVDATTIRLSNLLRGRRGTDVASDIAHPVGTQFVLLNGAILTEVNNSSTVGQTNLYRLPTTGGSTATATPESFTDTGRDLKPYAVAQVSLTNNAGDLTVDWVRRTRAGGQLRNNVATVPLNEDAELYDVEIIDEVADSVVRTFSGLTSPTVTYTLAQRTADGTDGDTNLRVRIYQISGAVGRGFARIEILEI